jgi:hypothetical protein
MNLTSWQQEHLVVCDSLYIYKTVLELSCFLKHPPKKNGMNIGKWCIYVGFLQKVDSYSGG